MKAIWPHRFWQFRCVLGKIIHDLLVEILSWRWKHSFKKRKYEKLFHQSQFAMQHLPRDELHENVARIMIYHLGLRRVVYQQEVWLYLAMASCVSAKSLWYMWSSILRRRRHSWNTSSASLIPTLSDNRTPFTKSSSASWASLHSSSMLFSKLHSRFWQVPVTPPLTEDSFMANVHLGQAKAEKHSLLFSISSSLWQKMIPGQTLTS